MNQLYACKRKAKGTTEFWADDSVSPAWFSEEQQDRKPGAAGRAPSTGSRIGKQACTSLYSQPDQYCLTRCTTTNTGPAPPGPHQDGARPPGTFHHEQYPPSQAPPAEETHPAGSATAQKLKFSEKYANQIYTCLQASV